MDDVDDVWSFAASHSRLDPGRALVWAHSEGALNVARLIGRGRLNPRGIQFVGSITESPASVFRWQTIERYVEHVMGWDEDGDGRVMSGDVQRRLPGDPLFAAVGMREEVVAAPSDGWTSKSLYECFAAEYEKMKADSFARPDDAPYPDAAPELRVVAASNNWWKQWFMDETPLIDHLSEYGGQAAFHIGGLDSQNPGRRQWSFAEGRVEAGLFARSPRLVFHERRGHVLRTGEPAIGPMDKVAKARLVAEAREMITTE